MHFDSYCPTYMLVLLCYAALHFQLETWYKLQILIHSASTDTFPPCFSKHCYAAALVEQFFDFRLLSTGNVNLQTKYLVGNWSLFPGIASVSVFLLLHKHYGLGFCLFCHPSVIVFC